MNHHSPSQRDDIPHWDASRILYRYITVMLFVLLTTAFPLQAQNTSQKKISYTAKDVTVKDALDEVRNLSGLSLWYNVGDIDLVRKVSVNAVNLPVLDVVNIVLKGQPVTAEIQGNHIIISHTKAEGSTKITGTKHQDVTGHIYGEDGAPLLAASVAIKGTTLGVVSGAQGEYTIAVPRPDAVLVFSYLGFITQEIPAGTRSVLDVTMVPDAQNMEEIVVVGYGIQRKRDVTGSIASLKTADVMAVPSSNALQSLQGKVAGLDMNINSGQITPGDRLTFNVRGNRSLKASNMPLIMVDGIAYGSTLDLNPSDIESIEVLKDASSTAIYGTRGANGVILVTTKRGSAGKAKIAFNAYGGVNKLTGQMEVFSGPEFIEYKKEAFRASGVTNYEEVFSAPEERNYIEKRSFTNWGDLVIHTGSTQNYELSVSSGTQKSSIIFSLGLNDTKGLLKNENQRRYNFRLSGDQEIFKNLKIGTNVIYTYKNNNLRRDPYGQAYSTNPISRPYDDEGEFILYPAPGYTSHRSALADEQPGAYKNNVVGQRIFASAYLDFNINKTWFFRSTFGLDSRNNRQGVYFSKNTLDGDSQSSQRSYITNEDYPNELNYTWENTLNYVKTLGKHDITVLVGSSTIRNRAEGWMASGKGQPDPNSEYWYLASNDKEITIDSKLTKSSLVSFFGRVNYKFNEKYIFSASLRGDGSSVLAEGHKWGYFPSASIGWRINDENFLKDSKWISDLKLRASWGQSGNSAISPYQTQNSLNKTVFAFAESPAYGYYPDILGNKNLTWETTTTINAGIDFSFWRGRLSGSVDYYNSDTKDLLMPKAVPSSNGYTSTWENVGKTNNKGFEIALSSVNLPTHSALQWTTSMTFSHNKEKIVSLAGGMEKDEASGWFVGQPAKVWYDYQKIGIWQLGEEEQAAKNGQKPGEIKVYTHNTNGKVTSDDRMILGSPRPKFNFGMNNTFTYKGVELSVFIYGKFGHLVASNVVGDFRPNVLWNCAKVDYWTPENPTNAYPRPTSSGGNAFTYGSTLRYIKGDFLKIRDITLGYTLPDKINKKLGISRLRVYGTATNFFTFCKSGFGSFDPEQAIYSSSASFPMMKTLVFGINFNY